MRAIVFNPGKSLDDDQAFESVEQATPEATGRDLLVEITAIGLNPVDTKIRQTLTDPQAEPKILGWDAVGVVIEAGEQATLFKPGDRVFYAGDVTRPGCYASHQLVDERIVGPCPASLDDMQAAAMPLTSLTAWEALFDRMRIDPEKDAGKSILIIGAAGGLGSIAIQLAKQVANLNVIATASRPESEAWCRGMGVDEVLNHRNNLADELKAKGLQDPDYIFCLADTDGYFPVMADIIAPQGLICAVVSSAVDYDMNRLKNKSAGFVWEFMFTRSMFNTNDMDRQSQILTQVSQMLDAGKIRSTIGKELGVLSPEAITDAHRLLESATSIGKLVMGV